MKIEKGVLQNSMPSVYSLAASIWKFNLPSGGSIYHLACQIYKTLGHYEIQN